MSGKTIVQTDCTIKDEKGENCHVCGKFVKGFEHKMCCNQFDCGCGGRPVEPCICSEECWNEIMRKK